MGEKEYLGDSVYAQMEPDGTVKLTTENGFGPSNTIYLDHWTLAALNNYVERMTQQRKEQHAEEKDS